MTFADMVREDTHLGMLSNELRENARPLADAMRKYGRNKGFINCDGNFILKMELTDNGHNPITLSQLDDSRMKVIPSVSPTYTVNPMPEMMKVAPREYKNFEIEKVIFNDPATIVCWKDGDKTVVKCSENDTFNKETGLALCYMKKALGNKGRYNDEFRRWI